MFKRKMRAEEDVGARIKQLEVSMRDNFEFSLRIKIEIRKEMR